MAKKRLDELLVERELVDDLDKARRLIMAGVVFSNQERLDKPGIKVDEVTATPDKTKGKIHM